MILALTIALIITSFVSFIFWAIANLSSSIDADDYVTGCFALIWILSRVLFTAELIALLVFVLIGT